MVNRMIIEALEVVVEVLEEEAGVEVLVAEVVVVGLEEEEEAEVEVEGGVEVEEDMSQWSMIVALIHQCQQLKQLLARQILMLLKGRKKMIEIKVLK